VKKLLSFTIWDEGRLGVDMDQPLFILCDSSGAGDVLSWKRYAGQRICRRPGQCQL